MKNSKIESKALSIPLIMGSLLILATLIVSTQNVFAASHEISEVFIESTGNNRYEAKIKAHERGMLRALFLIANKLNIPTDSLKAIPYHDLKEAFTTSLIIDEVSLLEKYSATVNYSYNRGELYNLLLENGNSKIDDLFYEVLVLPVFKQRSILNIWEKDKKWNDYWAESRKMLNSHKIFYPQKTMYLSKKITADNLHDLKYEDFLEIFHNRLFKSLMIITAEFFTDRRNGESLMQVKKYIYTAGALKPEIIEEDYDLATWSDIPYTVDIVIDKVIDDYGMLRESDIESELGELFEEIEIQRPVIMNFDVFDQEELDLVIAKLEEVNEIDSFEVKHDYNTRYKILIYTTVDEYELAEGLYLNGLSYKIHGSLYNLIDVKKGG